MYLISVTLINSFGMKKPMFRNLLAGISFTTAFFVFQACYGPPQDIYQDVYIHGKVVSEDTGEPVEGIRVSIPGQSQYIFTDSEGTFSLYTVQASSYELQFEDIDGDSNGNFANKDTLLENADSDIFVDVSLSKAN